MKKWWCLRKKRTPNHLAKSKQRGNEPTGAILFIQSFSINPFYFHYLFWNNTLVHSNSPPCTKTRAILWVSHKFLTPTLMNPHIWKQNPLFNQNSSMNTKAGATFRVSSEFLTITLFDPYPYIPLPIYQNWGNFWVSCVFHPNIHKLYLLLRM